MKHIVIVLAAVTATLAAATPAAAQYYGARGYGPRGYGAPADIISPREAADIVRAAGLDPVTRPMWRPGRYVMQAVDRYGRELRVVVDARFGEIVRAVPVGAYADIAPRGYGPYPRPEPYPRAERIAPPPPAEMDAPDEEYDGPTDLPPPHATPHVIPGPRSAAPSSSHSAALTPPKVKVTKPAATPLPRSRPGDAVASSTAAAPAAVPQQAAKSAPEAAPAPAPQNEIRMIDMSKPKPAEPADNSPVNPLEDVPAQPRF